jgi:5'-nucleotidase
MINTSLMKKERRLFLTQMSFMAAIAALNKPLASAASIGKYVNTFHSGEHAVTVYHTNDLHGNIDAVYNNMGGFNQIKTLLEKQETHGLLLDAGDFLNGSHAPSRQREVIYTMNAMGYHAAAIGNHELAQGQDHLAKLAPLMQFTLVNCNYRFDNPLSKVVKPYLVINSGKFKIGITGVGHLLPGIIYKDAIQSANDVAKLLKEKENCDLVICLSHLGYKGNDEKPDNQRLARESENIDLIISGHNRKLLRGPAIVLNKLKQEVVISQTAWDGLMMGRTIFSFESGKQKYNIKARHFIPGQPYDQTSAESFSRLRLMEKQPMPA